MRSLKKSLAVLLAMLMLFSVGVIASAAEDGNTPIENGEEVPVVSDDSDDEGVIAEFEYDNTDKTAKEDVKEYASTDNEYYYLPTKGSGTLSASITGDHAALKHMEWTDNIYSDTDENVLGIQPVFAASEKNSWSANAFVEMQFSTKGYSDTTIDFDIGASKKGPANYKVIAINDDETQELGTITLAKNKTMYSFTADLSEKFDDSAVTIQILLADTVSVGGPDLSENPSGGEIAINNIVFSGAKIEEETETEEPQPVSETETGTEEPQPVSETETGTEEPEPVSETETVTETEVVVPSTTETEPATEDTDSPAPVAGENEFVLTVKSNIFPTYSTVYNTTRDSEVTVTFNLNSKKYAVINCEGNMSYDREYVELAGFELKKLNNTVVNTELANRVAFNSTDISTPVVFDSEEFIVAKFKILKSGNTLVNFYFSELNACDEDVDFPFISDGKAVSSFYILSETSKPTPAPTEPEVKTVKLSTTKKTLSAGQTYKIKVKNNKKKVSSYTSNKKSVAVVSKSGKITALKKGTATITVKVDGKKLKFTAKVKNSPTAKIGKKAVSAKKVYKIKKGKTITVKLARKAKAIKNKYATSNKKIAKVVSKASASSVKIKGLKKGTAKIKITVNKTKSFKIKVKVD